jgi:hypothetical protein
VRRQAKIALSDQIAPSLEDVALNCELRRTRLLREAETRSLGSADEKTTRSPSCSFLQSTSNLQVIKSAPTRQITLIAYSVRAGRLGQTWMNAMMDGPIGYERAIKFISFTVQSLTSPRHQFQSSEFDDRHDLKSKQGNLFFRVNLI